MRQQVHMPRSECSQFSMDWTVDWIMNAVRMTTISIFQIQAGQIHFSAKVATSLHIHFSKMAGYTVSGGKPVLY